MILKYESYDLLDFPVFERLTFQTPFRPSTTYDAEACFIYTLAGNATLYGGLERDTMKAQESVFMKCGSFLNAWQAKKNSGPCEVIAIHIKPKILEYIYRHKIPEFLRNEGSKSTSIFTKISKETVVDEYIKSLVFYFDHPSLINEELIILKAKELILLLHHLNYGNIRELLQSMFDPVALSFKSIIKAQLFEELEVRDYAALANMSLSTFKRRFKEVFNDTPAHYINNKRLEKAAELLELTDKRVTEVCFECGFNSLSTFSKSFSKKYRIAPSEYKKTL
ncbi:MAG: AraC family transcriptional regulator [Bacteroidota bacterium]